MRRINGPTPSRSGMTQPLDPPRASVGAVKAQKATKPAGQRRAPSGPIAARAWDVAHATALRALLTRAPAVLPNQVGDPLLPLRVGIWDALLALLQPGAEPEALARALRAYTRSTGYFMLDLDTDFRKRIVGQQLTLADAVVSITRECSRRGDQAALASRTLGGSAMRAALNSGPMTPVAGGRRVIFRPSLLMATSWRRSRSRSTSPHAGRKPALRQRSSSSLRRIKARKEQNT